MLIVRRNTNQNTMAVESGCPRAVFESGIQHQSSRVVVASSSVPTVDDATYRLDREELARLITATAQLAAQNAAAKMAGVLAELERRQTMLLEQLADVDPDIAAALRQTSDSIRVPTAPDGGPYGYYQLPTDTTPQDDW